jgi:DNA-binding NtrC family response regulator
LLRSSGPVLLPEFLPPDLLREDTPEIDLAAQAESSAAADWLGLGNLLEKWFADGESAIYRRALEHIDRLILCRALDQSGGNQTRASETLGVSRFTPRAKLRATKLAVGKVVTPQKPEQSS